MSAKWFVDTNILICAHDRDAAHKHHRAAATVRDLWQSGQGVVSIQVLQEFYVNLTRKIPRPLVFAEAHGLLQNYSAWQIEVPTAATVQRASQIQEHNRLSFWGAVIVATAVQGGVDTLLTEDLNHSQLIEGIRVKIPHRHMSHHPWALGPSPLAPTPTQLPCKRHNEHRSQGCTSRISPHGSAPPA